MTKKKILIISIISIVVVAAAIAALFFSGMFSSPYEKQIQLAYKLLDEGNYEEAILAFDKAIEIDAKRDAAYIGKADVYVTRCDENALEDMKAVLETAYNLHYDDNNVVEAIMRLADDLAAKEQSDWALELLEFGYKLTDDERIKDHKSEIYNVKAGEFLKELYEMFEAGDKEGVRKEIQSEKYLNFAKIVDDMDYKYIYFPKENKEQTGKGIAVYYVDTEEYGKVFVYYGDFKKGIRSGTGTWAGANGIQYYWFEGEWANDAPNGKGELVTVKDESKMEKEPGYTYGIKTEVKGSFKEGKYHGTMSEAWHMDDGSVNAWNSISAVDGVYQEMVSPPEDIVSSEYAQESYAAGEYLVAVNEEGTDLWDNGYFRCILGFK